ncbi:M23 family metallopeptidase [Streptomyces sp. NPDC051320]|uniref:M23 family metallopeptidase n=1 Tax=Streptomyces sp. NPDC051320 TaxID=3154644 RepID=UPI00343E99D6
MNDQQTHAGYVESDSPHTHGYPTDGYPGSSYSTGTYAADPLFGDLPGPYAAGHSAHHSGQYDTTQWDTGAQQTAGYDAAYAAQQVPQGGGDTYNTTGQWSFPMPDHESPAHETGAADYDATGQWDANAWNGTGQFETAAHATTQWPAQDYGTQITYGTGTYGSTGAYAADGYDAGSHDTGAYDTGAYLDDPTAYGTSQFSAIDVADITDVPDLAATAETANPTDTPETAGTGDSPDHTEQSESPDPPPYELSHAPAARRASGGRGRRRTPAKRSALLTVAVPSVCVMGVAGVAAATVGGFSGDDSGATTRAAADPSSVKPVAVNNKLDTQLANLSHEADDFADRASRTQERIDLKQRQADAKKKAAEEAARKEAARPKFLLPVKQKGLSAYFGQAGVNWMSVHTGIDFPVSYGTPVMAATDGTVQTKWNSAYGNMAMVTAPDGTVTWYCHLSSTKIRSGIVKAGDVIAYSGNSGNSTGPHMHFEVHPHGGAAVDPLPWLRSHGLDPT